MLNPSAPPTGLSLAEKGTLRLGITGGIGSGKTTVARFFGVLGAPLYFADGRAKVLMEEDAELREAIAGLFGKDSYDGAGRLNTPHLASMAFSQAELRKKLNALVHPLVEADYEAWARDGHGGAAYTVKEAALLFEAQTYKRVHFVLHVSAKEDIRIARTLARDPHRSLEEVENIIRLQLAEGEREARSQLILHNNGERSVIEQALDIHAWLLERAKARG
jgi:dephospho-CoA kinase